MSTVKISDLPEITHLDNSTANTILLGVDIDSDVTAKFTVTTLAEGLFHNNSLKVGEEPITFANTIAQFKSSGTPFLQVNLQNVDGNSSSDYVATADIGTNANNFIDMGINGSTFTDPDYSAMQALDGYLYVQGSLGDSTNGNLVIGTASTGANVVIAPGGTTTENVVAHFTKNGLVLQNSAQIEFTDGSIQTVAAAPANLTQSAYNVANTATANTILLQGTNTWQNTQITQVNQYAASGYAQSNTNTNNIVLVNQYASSAYAKANAALANTSGWFDGKLVIANSGFSATESTLIVTASNNGIVQAPGGDGYVLHLSGKHNVPLRIVGDSFGANGQQTFVLFGGRAARGNVTNPSAVQTGDVLTRFSGSSYGTTQYQTGGAARIDIVASENHTDTARGTHIKLFNIATGTNTLNQIASFNADTVEFSGSVIPEKGFIYLPKTYNGAQTAITLNFANDTILRAQTSTGLTVTLSNFVYGKMVELWITNTAGTNQTFTHGCSAINSTVNSTTYAIPATSSILARYMSFDGDTANTFVSIIHA